MESQALADQGMPTWQKKALIIGTLVGALVGVGSAYLFIQSAEKQGEAVKVTPGDGIKLSLLVMGLLRQVAELGTGKRS